MTLGQLIALNYAWSGRDWIIIQLHSDQTSESPVVLTPIQASMAYGEEIVLGFDGDTIYLK